MTHLFILLQTIYLMPNHLQLCGSPATKDFLVRTRVCVCSVASVVSDSLRPYGLWPARLLCPWDSPGKNSGVGCCALLQGIFPTQGLILQLLRLLRCRRFFAAEPPREPWLVHTAGQIALPLSPSNAAQKAGCEAQGRIRFGGRLALRRRRQRQWLVVSPQKNRGDVSVSGRSRSREAGGLSPSGESV